MNRKRVCKLSLLSLVISLSGCDRQQNEPAPASTDSGSVTQAAPVPLDSEYRTFRLEDLGTDVELARTCAAEVEALRQGIDRLESYSGPVGVETYLEPLNALLVSAQNMALAATTLAAIHPDAAVRDAGDACTADLSGVQSRLSLSRPIYEHVNAVDLTAAGPETQRFVEKLVQGFRLAGVDRDDATRARIRQLNEEITATGLEFDRNILESVNYLELDSVDQLAGLPQDFIDAHPPGPDGKIRISTQYPDLFPFMTYAESDELRRQLLILSRTRAWPENEAVLKRLLTLRHEFANLLGYDQFADWVTTDKMVGSPLRVERFIEELAGYTAESEKREYAILLARLREEQPDADRVKDWQRAYLMEKVQSEQFNVDSRAIREYFSYEATRDGILTLVQDLFQVQFRPWDSPVWHEDVDAFEMWDGDRLIGRFYLDMHPREGKYQHAAAFPIQTGIAGRHVPVTALVCNFPPGAGLLQHSQVETFLHEFGHLIHSLFAGDHRWSEVTGINTEWDFVEAPSQMLQEWVWDYDTISRFARNARGETIPAELLARMEAARDFGLGLGTRRQLWLAALSLALYNRDPEGLDPKSVADELLQKYTQFEPMPEGHFYASFGHLNGYSAIYYTYQWSLAIASDLFTRFQDEGLRNVETAGDYRDRILAPGGARPAADLIADFLGRPVSFKPYADRLSRGGMAAATDE